MRNLILSATALALLFLATHPVAAASPTRLIQKLETRLLNRTEMSWVGQKLAEIDRELSLYGARSESHSQLSQVLELRRELSLVKKYYRSLDLEPSKLETERLTFALFELETGLEELSRQMNPAEVPLGAPLTPAAQEERPF